MGTKYIARKGKGHHSHSSEGQWACIHTALEKLSLELCGWVQTSL